MITSTFRARDLRKRKPSSIAHGDKIKFTFFDIVKDLMEIFMPLAGVIFISDSAGRRDLC